MKIELQRVRYMPKGLKPGVLYASEEFGIAIHLCACGCGTKVKTPLGPTEWSLKETRKGPSLYPSIGNWQLPCRSHYWISRGDVVWSGKWTAEEIVAGQLQEEERRRLYYEGSIQDQRSRLQKLWDWLKTLLKR